MENLMAKAEEAAKKHDSKTLYEITKPMGGGKRRIVHKHINDVSVKRLLTKKRNREMDTILRGGAMNEKK